MLRVTLIPGDGIGPEVTASAREIVTAAGAAVEWEIAEAGMRAGEKTGRPLAESVLESIRKNKLALKGPTQTPFGDPYPVYVGDRVYPSVAIGLRKELGFYAAVRPIKNYPGVKSRYDNVDFIIFRENSEDLYMRALTRPPRCASTMTCSKREKYSSMSGAAPWCRRCRDWRAAAI